jgi:hypothetical protein
MSIPDQDNQGRNYRGGGGGVSPSQSFEIVLSSEKTKKRSGKTTENLVESYG